MNKVEFCKGIFNDLCVGTYGDYDGDEFFIVEGWSSMREFELKARELFKNGEFPSEVLEDIVANDMEFADEVGDYTTDFLDYFSNGNWGFCDEYTTCDECYKVIRTSPDSYSWVADYVHQHDGLRCMDCVDKDEYIDTLTNNPFKANTILSEAELEEFGFKKMNNDEYENGWYGRADNPREILRRMREQHEGMEFVFSIASQGQFATEFDIWGRGV